MDTADLMEKPPSKSRTLTSLLTRLETSPLSAREKASGVSRDPILDHLYLSRAFRCLVVFIYVGLLGLLIWTPINMEFLIYALEYIYYFVLFPSIAFWIATFPWSTRLS